MTEQTAIEKGKEMVKELGKGWKYEVWQNPDWYVKVYHGLMNVHYSEQSNSYDTLLSDDLNHPGCGSILWSDNLSYKSPTIAVKHQLALARKELNCLTKIVEKAEKLLA